MICNVCTKLLMSWNFLFVFLKVHFIPTYIMQYDICACVCVCVCVCAWVCVPRRVDSSRQSAKELLKQVTNFELLKSACRKAKNSCSNRKLAKLNIYRCAHTAINIYRCAHTAINSYKRHTLQWEKDGSLYRRDFDWLMYTCIAFRCIATQIKLCVHNATVWKGDSWYFICMLTEQSMFSNSLPIDLWRV